MNLVVIAAFIAVCGAAKLDRTYLPPSSAESAGGSPGSLQAPLTRSSEQAPISLPTGSYTNDFGGVVVDAASPGTRASADAALSGLGSSRPSYGSTDSKVGDAAFRGSEGFRGTPSFEAASSQSGPEQSPSFNKQNNRGGNSFTLNGEINTHAGQTFPSNVPEINSQIDSHAGQFPNSNFQGHNENKSERPQAAKDRSSNILTLSNDVNTNSYSYGFQTDNGIAVGENGVAMNGIQAEGGYSYQGDDGQVYKVTYTADEGGYRPQGAHLPTPPPIPEEILKSLEQNAKEEAAGVVDDGSYDAQKYNTDGDYMHDNSASIQHNGAQFGKRPESNTPIGAFNQNSQAYGKPGAQFGARPNAQNTQAFVGQLTQGNGNTGSTLFGVASNEQNGQPNRKPGLEPVHDNSASIQHNGAQFGKQPESNIPIGALNQNSQAYEKPESQFGTIPNTQNTQAFIGQSTQGNGNTGTALFGVVSNEQNGQPNRKPGLEPVHDNSASIQHNGAQFGKQPESNIPIGAFNQNSQAYGKPEAQFGTRPNTQNTQAFIGQSTQGNGNTGSSFFGVVSNEQNGQTNEKPGLEQFGVTESQSTINGQLTQINNRPGSALFGSGSQSTHSTFQQSNLGNQFNHNPTFNRTFTQNANSGSHGSHSSQPQSGHEGLTSGQTFGQNTKNQFSSSSDQASGASGNQAQFGFQYGQQTSASAQFENYSPESSSQQNQQGLNAQFGSKPSKPSFSQGAGNIQSTHPQFGSSFKPQGSEAFTGASLNQDQDSQDFGKPSPQTFSGENFNRPAVGNVNKPSSGNGQINKGSFTANRYNRFPQASSQVEAMNDNPTIHLNGQSQSEKSKISAPVFPSQFGNSGLNLNNQGAQQNYHVADMVMPGKKPGFASASASTSFGKPASQLQPDKPLNFNTRLQTNPNQYNQQQNAQFTQQTNQLASQAPTQFNTNSQYSGQSVSDFGSKPTVVPDTELTTPLEPNETSALHGSHFPSQLTSNFGTTSNQAQTQFGHKGNSAFGQSTSQTTTSSHSNSPIGTALTQTGFQSSVGKRPGNSNSKPQLSENTFGQKQQNQGVDNSYYYKKPSMISPSVLPHSSKFPSSQTYQSTGVDTQNLHFSQQSFQSPTKFPGSPSFGPIGPTSSTPFAQTQGYSGITQAAISSFPSVSPTPSSQSSMIQNGPFGTQPNFNQQSSLGIPAQSPEATSNQQYFSNQAQITVHNGNAKFPLPSSGRFPIKPTSQIDEDLGSQVPTQFEQSESTPGLSEGSTQQQATQTQQHQGTIYEYNKPAEVLPAPTQTGSSSSQSIQAGITSESKQSDDQSQENQSSPMQNSNLAGSFGTQNAPFGREPSGMQRPNFLADQAIQTSQQTEIKFGSQPSQPFNAPSLTKIQFGQATQFEAQPAKPFSTTSTTHSGSLPLGSPSQNTQSSFEKKPHFDGHTSQSSHNFGSSRPFQPESGSGSQSIQNSGSSQVNGYIYPGNPKPQFDEAPKNQLNHNTPSVKPQSGGFNQFNQNTQSGFSQTMSFLNSPSSKFNPTPQFAQSTNQFNQAKFGQQAASPTQQFNQPQYRQPSASSQAVASGQASASASASTTPQRYKPFGIQNKSQFGQKTDDQNRSQSQIIETQNQEPFGSGNTGSNEAPSSKPYGTSAQGSKPLFVSACCQGSKDSTPAQSADRPSQTSFQGSQSFNTQGFAGKGEQFGGPRQPPSFDDQTGYHY